MRLTVEQAEKRFGSKLIENVLSKESEPTSRLIPETDRFYGTNEWSSELVYEGLYSLQAFYYVPQDIDIDFIINWEDYAEIEVEERDCESYEFPIGLYKIWENETEIEDYCCSPFNITNTDLLDHIQGVDFDKHLTPTHLLLNSSNSTGSLICGDSKAADNEVLELNYETLTFTPSEQQALYNGVTSWLMEAYGD